MSAGPKVAGSVTSTVTAILALVYEFAARHPEALKIIHRLLAAALNSGDPIRALRRAAMAIGAQRGVEAFVDKLLRKTRRTR